MRIQCFCLIGVLLLLCTALSAGAEEMVLAPSERLQTPEEDFTLVSFEGDNGLSAFLEAGGADSDLGVAAFLTRFALDGQGSLQMRDQMFGCSTFATKNAAGEPLFGRNFDWETGSTMIILCHPSEGYASLTTANPRFITMTGIPVSMLPDRAQSLLGLYAGMDGFNETGLAVSVNMISDNETIDQNTELPDLTTTTAVRLLLDRAASVDEAVEMLSAYDMHASMGMMVHFVLADRNGRSAVVEYIENTMSVIDTPVVTNFYLTPGDHFGIGTLQSHTRYETLIQLLENSESMEMTEVADALNAVSKHNFNTGEITEWSAVFNLLTGEAHYYHRENYGQRYVITLE